MINQDCISNLRCPVCVKLPDKKGLLTLVLQDYLECSETDCTRTYPIYRGTPVMMTEEGDFMGLLGKIRSSG